MTLAAALARARLLALMTPLLLLGGALGSQYIGGLFPCEMCMWQRWPHMLAIFFALNAYALKRSLQPSYIFTALAALAIAISGVIGVFHAGVEYGWWEGLSACTAPTAGGSAQDMLNAIMSAPLIRCDVAPWTLLGVSLAGFNALFSFGAAAMIAFLLLGTPGGRR